MEQLRRLYGGVKKNTEVKATISAHEADVLFNKGGLDAYKDAIRYCTSVHDTEEKLQARFKELDAYVASIPIAPEKEESLINEEKEEEKKEDVVFVSYDATRAPTDNTKMIQSITTLRNGTLVEVCPRDQDDIYVFYNGSCVVPKEALYIKTVDTYIHLPLNNPLIEDPERNFSKMFVSPDNVDRKLVVNHTDTQITLDEINKVCTLLEFEYPKYRQLYPDYMYHLKDTSERLLRDDVERFYRDCALRNMFRLLPPETVIGVVTKSEFDFKRVSYLDSRLIFKLPIEMCDVDVVLYDPYGRALEDLGLGTDYLPATHNEMLRNRADVWEGVYEWAFFLNNVRIPPNYAAIDNLKLFPCAPHRPRFLVTNVGMVVRDVGIFLSVDYTKKSLIACKAKIRKVVSYMVSASAYRNYMLTPIKKIKYISYWRSRFGDRTADQIMAVVVPHSNVGSIRYDWAFMFKKKKDRTNRSAEVMSIYAELGQGMTSEETFYSRGINRNDLNAMVLRGHLKIQVNQKRVYYYAPGDRINNDYSMFLVKRIIVDTGGVYGDFKTMVDDIVTYPSNLRDLVRGYSTSVINGVENLIYSHADRIGVRLPLRVSEL